MASVTNKECRITLTPAIRIYIKDLFPLLSLTLAVADSREIRNKNGRTSELEASNGKKKKERQCFLTSHGW